MEYKKPVNLFTTDMLKEIEAYNPADEEFNLTVGEAVNESEFRRVSVSQNDSITVITKNMVVDGDLTSDSPIAVNGRINGNVATTKALGISGLIIGDSKAENASLVGAKISGNVDAVSDIKIEEGSIVVGNLTADKVTINGKVKGVINATTVAEFGEDALVVGEVVTGAIHMKEEARVNARITLSNKNLVENSDEEFDLGV